MLCPPLVQIILDILKVVAYVILIPLNIIVSLIERKKYDREPFE